MATVRALSLALLLALCFGACACAPAKRMPKNRYISYAAGVISGGNGHSHSRIPPGCSAFTGKCPNSRRAPTEAGATTAAAGSKGVYMMSQAALPTKAGAKTGAAIPESKVRYISPAALNADRPCGWCGHRPPRP